MVVEWLARKMKEKEGAQAYFTGGVYREMREKVGDRWAIKVTVEALRRVMGGSEWPLVRLVALKYGFEV